MAHTGINPRQNNSEEFSPNVDNSIRKSNAGGVSKFLWYFLWIFIIPMILHVVWKNDFRRAETKINETASGIDVQLKKRKDTLIKLSDVMKSYVKYEKDVLTQITGLRNMNINNKGNGRNEMSAANDSVFGRLLAVREAYPDLKANKAAQELIEQSAYLEREIAASRRLYNSEVNRYNQNLVTFPRNVIAGSSATSMPYFVASSSDKEDVSLKF